MRALLLAALLTCVGAIAAAHSPLQASDPANDSVIAVVPETIHLTFNGNIRLTRITVTHDDTETVDLDLNRLAGFVVDHDVPFRDLGSGAYDVTWRGLGDDGHAQTGTFHFVVE